MLTRICLDYATTAAPTAPPFPPLTVAGLGLRPRPPREPDRDTRCAPLTLNKVLAGCRRALAARASKGI